MKKYMETFPESKVVFSWITAWVFAIANKFDWGVFFDTTIQVLSIISLLVAINYTIYKHWSRWRSDKKDQNNNTK